MALLLSSVTMAARVVVGQETSEVGQLRIDGKDQEARIVRKVTPEYPPLARQTKTEGVVPLEAIVAKDGKIKELNVTTGHPLLVQSALNAVRQWQYAPTLLNGKRVEVLTEIDVYFSLERDPNAPKPIKPDEGSLTGDIYTSRYFRFTYPLPKDWKVYDAKSLMEAATAEWKQMNEGKPEAQAEIQTSAGHSYGLFLASEHSLSAVAEPLRNISVHAEQVSDVPGIRTGGEYLERVKRAAERHGTSLQFQGEAREVSVAGKQFFRLDGQASARGAIVYEASYATVMDGYALRFDFVSQNQKDLEALCATMAALHFEEKAH